MHYKHDKLYSYTIQQNNDIVKVINISYIFLKYKIKCITH